MSDQRSDAARPSRFAWMTLVIVGGLLVLFGLYVLVISPVDPDDFEATTGQVWAEFSASNPDAAGYLEREARLLAVLAVGFGLFAASLAWYGVRRGIGLAIRTTWIVKDLPAMFQFGVIQPPGPPKPRTFVRGNRTP